MKTGNKTNNGTRYSGFFSRKNTNKLCNNTNQSHDGQRFSEFSSEAAADAAALMDDGTVTVVSNAFHDVHLFWPIKEGPGGGGMGDGGQRRANGAERE